MLEKGARSLTRPPRTTFLLGDDKAPITIVNVKRILADYSAPFDSEVDTSPPEEDGMGLAFVESSHEWIKSANCFGCSKKGHILNRCTSTSKK